MFDNGTIASLKNLLRKMTIAVSEKKTIARSEKFWKSKITDVGVAIMEFVARVTTFISRAARAFFASIVFKKSPLISIRYIPLLLLVVSFSFISTDFSNAQASLDPDGQTLADPARNNRPKRIALVIGNSNYEHVRPLTDPSTLNDAKDVADTLERIGFKVLRGIDLKQIDMIEKLAEFYGHIGAGDTALLYYSGHGANLGGNYYMPIDVPDPADIDIDHARRRSISEDDVVRDIQGRTRANGVRGNVILIIDACRNLPTFGKAAGAQATLKAPNVSGTIALYAAGSGQIAFDRFNSNESRRNSVFTGELLPYLEKKNLLVRDILADVSDHVSQLAAAQGREQDPALYLQGAYNIVLNPDESLQLATIPDTKKILPDATSQIAETGKRKKTYYDRISPEHTNSQNPGTEKQKKLFYDRIDND